MGFSDYIWVAKKPHQLPILLPLFQKLPGIHTSHEVRMHPWGWTSGSVVARSLPEALFFLLNEPKNCEQNIRNLKQLHWLPQDPLFRSLIHQDYGRNIFSKFQIWEFWTILRSLKRLHQLPVWIKHSKLWRWGVSDLAFQKPFCQSHKKMQPFLIQTKVSNLENPEKFVNSSACLEKNETPKSLQKHLGKPMQHEHFFNASCFQVPGAHGSFWTTPKSKNHVKWDPFFKYIIRYLYCLP